MKKKENIYTIRIIQSTRILSFVLYIVFKKNNVYLHIKVNNYTMSEKQNRLDAITEIVEKLSISNQQELIEQLHIKGFNPTQATLSRDLKELGVAKHPTSNGGFKYITPTSIQIKSNSDSDLISLSSGFKSIEFSKNLAVCKTAPGFASTIASIIDKNKNRAILGTIAGDDTILLIIKEGAGRGVVTEDLVNAIPNLKRIIN